MANPSPTCLVRVNGGSQTSTLNGINCNGGDSIEIDLASVAGVSMWVPSIVGQDDLVTPPTLTVNNTNKTATFTAPAAPFALIFQSQVNNGRDVNNVAQSSYTTTFGIYALSSGNRLFATNERFEGSSLYGWITKFNSFIRSGGGGGGSGYAATVSVTGTGTTTISQTSGRIYVPVSALTGTVLVKAPASPSANMSIVLVAIDNTFSNTNTIQFGGNGHHVNYNGAQDAGGANLSPAFNPGTMGFGGIEWSWTGTLWAAT